MSDEPLRVLTYSLKPADAWDYAARPRPFSLRARFILAIWVLLACPILWFLPSDWAGGLEQWRFWLLGAIMLAIQYVLALIAMTLAVFVRARRLVPHPIPIILSEWPDHFTILDRGKARDIPFSAIRSTILTPAGLTVWAGGEALILPRRALPGPNELEALAAFLKAYGHDRVTAQLPDTTPAERLPPISGRPSAPQLTPGA